MMNYTKKQKINYFITIILTIINIFIIFPLCLIELHGISMVLVGFALSFSIMSFLEFFNK